MNAVYILQNLKLRIVLSWIAIRYIPKLFAHEVSLFPLLLLTAASTIILGLLIREKPEAGTPLVDTAFTPIDAQSPRIEDDILTNNRHIEIIISNQGVYTNL